MTARRLTAPTADLVYAAKHASGPQVRLCDIPGCNDFGIYGVGRERFCSRHRPADFFDGRDKQKERS